MTAPRVLIYAKDADVYARLLRDRLPELETKACTDDSGLKSALEAHHPEVVLASIIGRPFPRQTLFDAPSVRWVQAASAGVDHLLPIEPDVLVTSASGVHDDALADYVICACLMWNLHFHDFFRDRVARRWQSRELIPSRGQTLVVLGFGSVGRAVAGKALGFGMRVVGVRARPLASVLTVEDVEVVGVERLSEVVGGADFLAVTLPLTDQTKGLLNHERLQSMKEGSVLVNISRGGIVDEDALAHVLRHGPVAFAVSDVFATEPLPPESELWDLENLVITPHTGDIRGWQERVTKLFADNLIRWIAKEPLVNVVDPVRGY